VGISELELTLMELIDRQYLETPYYGSRKMTEELKREGYPVNRKRIRRLMQIMGLRAIYRRPRTSSPGKGNKIYPYLLKGLQIERPNQVWAADITYIPMEKGFLYLVAIIDLYSRYVLSWRLSNSLDTSFCVEALIEALQKGTPEIFNTDQGSQFTSDEFVSILAGSGIRVSMDSVGRYADNIFVERFWRTLKYEEVYLKIYRDGRVARSEIGKYIRFYNTERPHQSLGYKTPAEEYSALPLKLLKNLCYNPINQAVEPLT
jgi:putative transposase